MIWFVIAILVVFAFPEVLIVAAGVITLLAVAAGLFITAALLHGIFGIDLIELAANNFETIKALFGAGLLVAIIYDWRKNVRTV